jgi:hypothetical protein
MRAISIFGPVLAVTSFTLGSACTVVDPNDDNPFGSAPPMTSPPPETDTGDATETGGSGTGGSGSSTGPALTTAPLDSSSSSGPPLTTGMSMESSSSSDGGGGNGMQPNTGMWMPCVDPRDCDYSPALCITIGDLGGFCSDVGCMNPAADCAASPNGIAVPVCVPVTVNMMADTACALQCTGGLACPAPMECVNVEVIGEICV